MIGEELSLLKIMHLIEYKNNKTKIEIINIIVELYKGLLDKKIYNFDNWKIKIIKSAIILYFEKDLINKNKLIFIIKDLYLSFKNEIWKYCQNISLNNKEELIKIIGEKKNIIKNNFDNNYQTYSYKKSNIKNENISNYIFSTITKNKNENNNTIKNSLKSKETSKHRILNFEKLNSNRVYNKKNIKKNENIKNSKLNNEEFNESIEPRKNNNLTDVKNNTIKNTININDENKFLFKYMNKKLNIDNSLKKNLFLKHINTFQNIRDNSKYENIINEEKNKILLNNDEETNNYKNNMEKNKLSQSTVIINNNYNFIKIKNNIIHNKNIEKNIRP